MSSCVGCLRGTAWGSSGFFHQLNSCCFLQLEIVGLIFLALESWDRGPGVGLRLFDPEISLLNFYPHGCGVSPFCACAPPTSLDGCGLFNVVVRLPINLISDGSECWLFLIFSVILMWLCEEGSHVCPHCHLDQKP